MSAPKLFAGKGIALIQAQQLSGSLAALCAFLACAVSEEFGPALLLLFPVALVGAHFFARSMERDQWVPFAWGGFICFGLVLRALFTGLGIG